MTLPLGKVIKGWREGVVIGDKVRFWIPTKLAYGKRPPEGAPAGDLVYDIELLDIMGGRKKGSLRLEQSREPPRTKLPEKSGGREANPKGTVMISEVIVAALSR